MSPDELSAALIDRVRGGDREALEQLITAVQGQVYNLAIRMLRSPADAEDATQEILIKVITHLGSFRGASAFTTWVYRIAANHLVNTARSSARERSITFDGMGAQLELSLAHGEPSVEEQYDAQVLSTEIRRHCTLGMLLCLDRDQRIALILGELFEIDSQTAAEILEIPPATYRKRLSRARAALVAFVAQRCGIVNPDAPCRCHKHIGNSIQSGSLRPDALQFAHSADHDSQAQYVRAQQHELSAVCRTTALLRSHPQYRASDQLVSTLRAWLTDPHSHLLENRPLLG